MIGVLGAFTHGVTLCPVEFFDARRVLETIDFNVNDDDFVFDNEMLSQIVFHDFRIGEVTCPTKYFKEASSINFSRSVKYGLGVLRVSFGHFFTKIGIANLKRYQRRDNGLKSVE